MGSSLKCEVRLSVVENCKRLQVMSSPVCADPQSLPGDEMEGGRGGDGGDEQGDGRQTEVKDLACES